MIKSYEKPKINIWIFNNPIRGITEQLDYLILIFRQNGYRVAVSNKPSLDSLNLLIENLNEKTLNVVRDFVERSNKRVAVIMTEHIDFVGGKIFFHGLPINHPSEYMHKLTRRSRLLHLMIAKNYIKYFIRLGDLPKLEGFHLMVRDTPIITIPFPKISFTDRSLEAVNHYYDFAFTGMVTTHRKKILDALTSRYKVIVSSKQLSRRRRDAINSSAKAVINIPQDNEWPWVSTMRVMASWRCGRPVVNLASDLEGVVAKFCVNVPAVALGSATLQSTISSSSATFNKQLTEYNQFVESDTNKKFPDSSFYIWALTELNR